MLKRTIIASLLATAAGATLAADYYVVVPLQGKQALLNGISVALNSTSLPTGVVGQPYMGVDLSQALQVTGDPAYSSNNVGWSVVAGSLPAGLVLTKGAITGTPTAAGEQAFSVRATYKTKTGEQAYKILTFAVTVALATGTLPQGVVGVAYPIYDLKPLLAVTGDPSFNPVDVTWGVVSSTLPAGLTLKADGTITGTPTAAGTGAVTARATYRGVNGTQTYQVVTLAITVGLVTATLPQGVAGVAYPTYDLTPLLTVTGDPAFNPANVTWSVVSSALPPGLTLKADGTISGTPTTAGAGTLVARATHRGVNGTQTYQVVTLAITVGLVTATLPQAVVGVPYTAYDMKPLLTVSGDPAFNSANVTWTVVTNTLPAGLTLKSDGTISGAPTTSGTGTLVARASYKGVNGEQTYQVVTLGITVNLATATLPQGLVGTAYTAYDLKPRLTVSGDPAFNSASVTWSTVSSTLPSGVSLKADGTISGTPTVAGTGSVVARAAYRGVNGEQTYQLVTVNIAVALAPSNWPSGSSSPAAYYYADQTVASSCKTYRQGKLGYDQTATTGYYWVNMGAGIEKVYCDMATDGGGWTLVARSAPGSAATGTFGWSRAMGSAADTAHPYSLNVMSRNLAFTEALVGDAPGNANTWGAYVYKIGISLSEATSYSTTNRCTGYATPVSAGASTYFGMTNCIGLTASSTNSYHFGDMGVQGPDSYGLFHNGWSTYYGTGPTDIQGQAAGAFYGGYVNNRQGMLMVR